MNDHTPEEYADHLERLADTVQAAIDRLRAGTVPDMRPLEREVIMLSQSVEAAGPDIGMAVQTPLRRLIRAFSELSEELEHFLNDPEGYNARFSTGQDHH